MVWMGRDSEDHPVPPPDKGRDTSHHPRLLQSLASEIPGGSGIGLREEESGGHQNLSLIQHIPVLRAETLGVNETFGKAGSLFLEEPDPRQRRRSLV